MKHVFFVLFIAIFLVPIFIFFLPILAVLFDFLFLLAVGWMSFLYRVLPHANVNWAALITWIFTVSALTAGSHFSLRWLSRQIAQEGGIQTWRTSWTLAIVSGVVLMFVAGIAAIGMTHQVLWMLTSGDNLQGGVGNAVQRTLSRNHLKVIGLAVHNYADIDTVLPPAAVLSERSEPLHGWQTLLVPFVESKHFGEPDYSLPWNHPQNKAHFQQVVSAFLIPKVNETIDVDGYALTHHSGNGWLLARDKPLRVRDITDGTTNTILTGEINANFPPWGKPLNVRDTALGINKSADGFGSPFEGGMHFLMADGSVHFVNENIDPVVLRAFTTPSAGDKATLDY